MTYSRTPNVPSKTQSRMRRFLNAYARDLVPEQNRGLSANPHRKKTLLLSGALAMVPFTAMAVGASRYVETNSAAASCQGPKKYSTIRDVNLPFIPQEEKDRIDRACEEVAQNRNDAAELILNGLVASAGLGLVTMYIDALQIERAVSGASRTRQPNDQGHSL